MRKKCYHFFGGLLNAQANWLNKMSEKGNHHILIHGNYEDALNEFFLANACKRTE